MRNFPKIEDFSESVEPIEQESLLIISEGFEDRSLSWLSALPKEKIFQRAIIFTYRPEKKSRLEELRPLVEARSKTNPQILEFFRFEPQKTETLLMEEAKNWIVRFKEIILDISVMSKLMIMLLIILLKDFNGRLRIIYTEPMEYAPSEDEYEKQKSSLLSKESLPSYGVHNVVRTSLLTSVVMQSSPTVLIAFTSFNEQLIRSLLSIVNPTMFFLINGVPPHLRWREQAMQEIHSFVIREYERQNMLDGQGQLLNRASTFYYSETYEMLARLYKKFCYTNRIILAPTGSKLQALGCALFKLSCPDVHIEYPTPESFLFQGYSSKEIKQIHSIVIDGFSEFINLISTDYELNG